MGEPPKYRFSWNLLGNLEVGRPNLGPTAHLEVYRLMQFTMRDALEQKLGTRGADEIFYQAGRQAGTEFYRHILHPTSDLNDFVRQLQVALRERGIGILRMERADVERGFFVLTVSEDLECSGMPELDYEICVYDEGFIAGLLESFAGRPFKVKEIDCWCTGERTCRFSAQALA